MKVMKIIASSFQVSRDGKAIIVANSVDDCIHRKIGLSFGLVKRSHKSNFRIHWDYYHHGIIEVSHVQSACLIFPVEKFVTII